MNTTGHVIGSHAPPQPPPPVVSEHLPMTDFLLAWRKYADGIAAAASSRQAQRDCIVRLLQEACSCRRLGVLRGVHVGMFPAAAKAKDNVVIFDGGNIPYFLRKVSDSGSEYQLIGECYLDGLMDGQALDIGRASGIDEITLTLV